MPNGGAEEAARLVRHLEEPTRPAPRIAPVFGVGEIPHHRQRLIARGGSVRQFHAFLVRHGALTEAEMEKITRHDLPRSTGRWTDRSVGTHARTWLHRCPLDPRRWNQNNRRVSRSSPLQCFERADISRVPGGRSFAKQEPPAPGLTWRGLGNPPAKERNSQRAPLG